jgi:hypothetical protein
LHGTPEEIRAGILDKAGTEFMAWLAIPALLWLAMPAHLACILSFQWLNGGQMAVEKAAGTLP